jgi:hypothetical protein
LLPVWRAIGDPQFASVKKPVTGVCECFGDSKAAEVQDWVSVFEGLRASEAKAEHLTG